MGTDQKTALVLGGGGSRGAYEIGVWQAMIETGQRIDMVVGSSVGAINGTLVAQNAFDLGVKIWKEMKSEIIIDSSVLKHKKSPLRTLLEQYVDEAAIRRGPIEYGLVTVELPSMEPRHLFISDIPQGKLIDFIQASAALIPVFLPQDIDDVKYVDGGYVDNLPIAMAVDHGATRIIAVDLDSGIVRKHKKDKNVDLTRIRSKWDLGNILHLDRDTTCRNIRLGYLDAMKAFGFFEGESYCFTKGEMSKGSLAVAEETARAFLLTPEHIYTNASFQEQLKDAVVKYQTETAEEVKEMIEHIQHGKPDIDHLPKLLGKINSRSLILIIADFLKHHEDAKETLWSKPVFMLFKDEYLSAGYLLKEKLL